MDIAVRYYLFFSTVRRAIFLPQPKKKTGNINFDRLVSNARPETTTVCAFTRMGRIIGVECVIKALLHLNSCCCGRGIRSINWTSRLYNGKVTLTAFSKCRACASNALCNVWCDTMWPIWSLVPIFRYLTKSASQWQFQRKKRVQLFTAAYAFTMSMAEISPFRKTSWFKRH